VLEVLIWLFVNNIKFLMENHENYNTGSDTTC